MTAAVDSLPDPIHLIAFAAVTSALAGDWDLLASILNDTDDDEQSPNSAISSLSEDRRPDYLVVHLLSRCVEADFVEGLGVLPYALELC